MSRCHATVINDVTEHCYQGKMYPPRIAPQVGPGAGKGHTYVTGYPSMKGPGRHPGHLTWTVANTFVTASAVSPGYEARNPHIFLWPLTLTSPVQDKGNSWQVSTTRASQNQRLGFNPHLGY